VVNVSQHCHGAEQLLQLDMRSRFCYRKQMGSRF